MELIFSIKAASNARLIGNDDYLVIVLMGKAREIKYAIYKVKVLDRMNISIIDIDNTIPIKEKGRILSEFRFFLIFGSHIDLINY